MLRSTEESRTSQLHKIPGNTDFGLSGYFFVKNYPPGRLVLGKISAKISSARKCRANLQIPPINLQIFPAKFKVTQIFREKRILPALLSKIMSEVFYAVPTSIIFASS